CWRRTRIPLPAKAGSPLRVFLWSGCTTAGVSGRPQRDYDEQVWSRYSAVLIESTTSTRCCAAGLCVSYAAQRTGRPFGCSGGDFLQVWRACLYSVLPISLGRGESLDDAHRASSKTHSCARRPRNRVVPDQRWHSSACPSASKT